MLYSIIRSINITINERYNEIYYFIDNKKNTFA